MLVKTRKDNIPMNINFQTNLRPPVSTIYGPADYRDFRKQLEAIDTLLDTTGMEDRLIANKITKKSTQYQIEYIHMELRVIILLNLTNESYRKLAFQLADSYLYRWFIGINEFSQLKPPSKSSIQRAEHKWDKEEISEIILHLNRKIFDPGKSEEILYSDSPLDYSKVYADSTCIKANIHHPVDWLLFRDAVKTIIGGIKLIRSQGILNRMKEPDDFVRKVNKLTIEMTHASRNRNGARLQKKILRRMKKLLKKVEKHGYRYYSLLKQKWEITEWSKKQADQVLQRISNILEQIPSIVDIAHRRIIGGKKVPNSEKILSLYEKNVHVIKRGKFDANVEFGNGFYLAEQEDGLIVDWDFFSVKPLSDTKILQKTTLRIKENYSQESFSIATDRGFNSKTNDKFLDKENIFNATCPRDPKTLKIKMADEKFREAQKRRAQTEARIGIFKNKFIGNKILRKGIDNRGTKIIWSILIHNLWIVARIANKNQQLREKEFEEAA